MSSRADLAAGLTLEELIPGDVEALFTKGDRLRGLAELLDVGGDSLSRVDVGPWIGEAADAFFGVFDFEPREWHKGADAIHKAASALKRFAEDIQAARRRAEEAQRMWNEGEAATAEAKAEQDRPKPRSDDLITEFSRNSGIFLDPGESKRQKAVQMLDDARDALEGQGDHAASIVRGAADQATKPRFWEGDGLTGQPSALSSAGHSTVDLGGLVPGVGEIADGLNAAWYAAEGDPTNAGISLAGMIPLAGMGATGTRALRNVAKSLDDVPAVAKGWRVGDPITNLTHAGNEASWTAVRNRWWKNEAAGPDAADEYSPENLARMRAGKPPLHDEVPVPMELDHIVPRHMGGTHTPENLRPLWPWQHDKLDPYRHYRGPRPEGE
jgi:uncharacterized protein YukE